MPEINDQSSGGPAVARPAMPKLWIGYLLALATFIGEGVAVARHPELLKPQPEFAVPPLEIFLPTFIAGVYWLVCIYRYHKILANIPGYKHSISPAKAVGYHFIPIFNIFWVFVWPLDIAKFVNARVKPLKMRGWVVGLSTFIGILCRVLFDPALGITLIFLSLTYLASFMVRALLAEANPDSPQT
jgi:hypothetical protein